jgi:lysophospholipase L1-like esterase
MRAILTAALILAAPLLHAQEPKAKQTGPKRWEKAIEAFEEKDKKSPPTPGGIVFTGSSSIARWKDVDKAFPEHHVLNRGFGGSQLTDVNYFIDRVVIAYKPRIVVLFCGGNDLAAKKTPEQVDEQFRKFVKTVHAKLPDTRVFYLSIHLPPGRVKLKEQIDKTNELIKADCDKDSKLKFVDIRDTMLGADGQPDPTLYADPLHPTQAAYARWVERLRPLFKQ